MTTTDATHVTDDLDATLAELTASLTAIRQGDSEPYTAHWSKSQDVTLFGAWGPIEHGIQQLADTFHWVASRFGPEGETVQDIREIHQSGDLAITVGFERGAAQVDGGPPFEMVIRVTHAFRREPDGWRLIHRHADFPPSDPRQE